MDTPRHPMKYVPEFNDSDEAFGIVEFGPQEEQQLITSTSPRRIRLKLLRRGGTLGDVRVSFSVDYIIQGKKQDTKDYLIRNWAAALQATFSPTQQEKVVDLRLKDAAFLHVQSYFNITLLDHPKVVTDMEVVPGD
jgi:hypothetical protein